MQIEGLVSPSQEWGAQHEGVGVSASFVVPPYAAICLVPAALQQHCLSRTQAAEGGT